MNEDKIFADGFIVSPPRKGAPEYVRGSVSIKVDEAMVFLQKHRKADGWVNLDLKKSKAGKLYLQLNMWRPGNREERQDRHVELTPVEDMDFTPNGEPFP